MAYQKEDFFNEMEKRLRHFNFTCMTSAFHQVDNWIGTSVVNDVFKLQQQHKYKSKEETILHRMELWVDVCRIEKATIELSSSGRFPGSIGIFQKIRTPKLKKSHTFNKGMTSAKSIDGLHSPQLKEKRKKVKSKSLDGRVHKPLSLSTIDLSLHLNITADISLTDTCSSSDDNEEDVTRSMSKNVTRRMSRTPRLLRRFFPLRHETVNESKSGLRKENGKNTSGWVNEDTTLKVTHHVKLRPTISDVTFIADKQHCAGKEESDVNAVTKSMHDMSKLNTFNTESGQTKKLLRRHFQSATTLNSSYSRTMKAVFYI